MRYNVKKDFLSFFYFVKKQNLAPFRYIFLPKDQSVTFVKNRLSYIHGSFCLFWPLSFFPASYQDKSVSVLTLQHALYLYLSPQVQFWFHRTISNILGSLHFLMVIGWLCEHWFKKNFCHFDKMYSSSWTWWCLYNMLFPFHRHFTF